MCPELPENWQTGIETLSTKKVVLFCKDVTTVTCSTETKNFTKGTFLIDLTECGISNQWFRVSRESTENWTIMDYSIKGLNETATPVIHSDIALITPLRHLNENDSKIAAQLVEVLGEQKDIELSFWEWVSNTGQEIGEQITLALKSLTMKIILTLTVLLIIFLLLLYIFRNRSKEVKVKGLYSSHL
jgi:hypothetical protein